MNIWFSATHQSGSNNLVAHLLPIVLTCSSTHNLQVRITPTLRNPSVFKHSGKQQASPWGLGLHLLSLNSSNATTCRPRDGTHACSVAAGRGAGPPALTVSKERTSTRRPPPGFKDEHDATPTPSQTNRLLRLPRDGAHVPRYPSARQT